jgi:hypothetical protein
MNADARWERALRHVAGLASGPALEPGLRVTLNFHPDRTDHRDRTVPGRSILAAMAEDGAYRSQFVTGTSNGGLTAYPGGDRWLWESRMFGAAYDDEAAAHERPVYGALDFRRGPLGGAPRFGSAYLRLSAGALARTTFCYPDSVFEPTSFGIASAMPLIDLAEADRAAGRTDALDDYIEAQVHGPVLLGRDIEALVLDPRVIGDAARTGRHDPQDLKRVWHLLARFGTAAGSASAALSAADPAAASAPVV